MFILPTMSRPDNVREILGRIKASGCTSKGIVFFDGQYDMSLNNCVFPEGWVSFLGDRNYGCIGALNKVFEMFPNEPWYGFLADDEFLLEGNPDDIVKAAGSWDIAHGWDDLHKGARLQGYVVFGGELVRAVGYLGVKECFHNFGFDSAWEWLCSPYTVLGGCNAAKIYLVDRVRIEHRHAGWGKSKNDECYQKGFSTFEDDRKRFVDWQNGDMRKAAERIKNARKS